ncbi:hypothetical protein PgNI_06573 [Pyricularia grisea]|uniref:Uncharacterized protein n=1 Tax=Pyricularia grisea TaxID=148305 RepID=A0A6P8B5X9_PYRGI|nr:hypothetical protein PgNI_06573 [Pyricularia grisea]TLD10712.1 hypothetical protein PgNI_06573 [Pyricularia grisea]
MCILKDAISRREDSADQFGTLHIRIRSYARKLVRQPLDRKHQGSVAKFGHTIDFARLRDDQGKQQTKFTIFSKGKEWKE